jgi:multidrug resistance protein, MATE family
MQLSPVEGRCQLHLPFLNVSSSSSYLSEARRTLVLAGPIIIGQVSQMLMGVTDAVMIGQVGKVPLAASAFAGSLFGFFFMVVVGLMIPISILVSRAHGGGDEAEASEWMKHGVVLATIAGVAGILVMLGLGTQLHRFGQPEEVLAVVQPYYTIIMVSVLPTIWFQVLRQFGESLERPLMPMIILLAGVALNVLLNWIFIYGNWGAPAMGLTGAGWATLISRFIGVFVILAWITQSGHFKAAWPQHWWGGYVWRRFKRLLGLGVPIAFSLSFEAGAFGAAAIMMGWFGSTALAAHQIAITCAALTFMFPLGLAMAVGMRVGRAVGEGRLTALRAIGNSSQYISATVMGTFALLFVFAGEPLANAFVNEPEVIALAAKLLIVAALFQLADGGQVVAAAALRGLTDVKVPTAITALAYWGFALPTAWWFGFRLDWGPIGIWYGLAAGLTVAAVALTYRFMRMTRDDGAHVVLEAKPANPEP